MSLNILITQTISCFEEVLKFLASQEVNKENKYLSSLVNNLTDEWKQQQQNDNNNKSRRQMSDHVVSSKKNFEDTLERVRRISKIETKKANKDMPIPDYLRGITAQDTDMFLSVPKDVPPRAPTLPPRNILVRGNVLKEKSPRTKEQVLKPSNSCCELAVNNVNTRSRGNTSKTLMEPKNTNLFSRSYDSNALVTDRQRSITPELIPLAPSPELPPPREQMKTTRSCNDLLSLSTEDLSTESSLLSNSLRSSHVKFKIRAGKWVTMYVTLVGRNVYVSRNYADDKSELIYALEDYEIVPKDESRSKFLIQLKTNNTTQATISMQSEDIRDDWYKAMIRAKYRPKYKSPMGSVEAVSVEPAPERPRKNDRCIYVSANTVDLSAARDMGIKVVIQGETPKGDENRSLENEYIEMSSTDYVIDSIEDNYLALLENTRGRLLGNMRQECSIDSSSACGESDYFLVPNV